MKLAQAELLGSGKPLVGAARMSFIQKCKRDAGDARAGCHYIPTEPEPDIPTEPEPAADHALLDVDF